MILVINCGSSSLKFAVFSEEDSARLTEKVSGEIRQIGHAGTELRLAHGADGDRRRIIATDRSPVRELLEWMRRELGLSQISHVGYRVVHGGTKYREPVELTSQVIRDLKALIPIAPNHLPEEINAIEEIKVSLPHAVHIAAFDTAFHHDMPDVARFFALPRALADKGIMRYGFHGLSYEYVVSELRRRGHLPRRMIIAHLGSGASLVAVKDGKSVDTTMGMTPTGGIPMGTRAGDLDPGMLVLLAKEFGYSIQHLEELVNHQSGLLGISGVSSDMRELLASENKQAKLAIETFAYSVRKTVGAYATAMGGLDALIFTGGIGENAADVRSQVAEGLEFLGVELDEAKNRIGSQDRKISAPMSPVSVEIIKTNEELMIARHISHQISSVDQSRHSYV